MEEEGVLLHYGTPRKSGRYPWGSGEDGFLAKYDRLRATGMTEKEVAKALGMNTSELRSAKALANEEAKKAIMDQILPMHEQGLSNAEISRRTGIPARTVSFKLATKDGVKLNQIESTANMLKDNLKESPYLDVGVGTEQQLGISKGKLKAAISKLEDEGYYVHEIYIPQVGNPGKWTTAKVLTKSKDINDVREHRGDIKPPGSWTDDGGLSYLNLKPVKNISWDRVGVRYDTEGGLDRDGVVLLRRGKKDLDLGNKHYAQVRIGIDGTHYVKGMAMYADDSEFPKGVDVIFNTNKAKGTPKKKVFKEMKDNKDNPFGATIQRQAGALNIVNEEGDWAGWDGSKFSSQFLSKQPLALVKDRLNVTYKGLADEYDSISKLTNPLVKKRLLEDYASNIDSKARELKVMGLPRTKAHVLLPFPKMKPNEVYAPNYKDGENVVLVRYPHGGTFEIPELKVNNKYAAAKKAIGSSPDAIGIHPSVAHKLSGADFDGDAVYLIPNNNKSIKATSSLAGLKDFDPNQYSVGHKTISSRQKQTMMGEVSNLITDMTIKGASTSEITRAVRHSMVVIDSEKHNLDWKQSAADNGIAALRKKYQTRQSIKYDPDTKQLVKKGYHTGASTLISRSKSEVVTPDYYDRGPKKGTARRNADGSIKTTKTPIMDMISDAHTLSSGTAVENSYADYINKLKSLSNKAKKSYSTIPPIKKNKEASKLYLKQVKSLETKLRIAEANAPKERRAQIIANSTYSKNVTKDMTPDQKKKLKAQALAAGRVKAGAQKAVIDITPGEWEAIQAGALSNNALDNILKNANMDKVKKLATPKPVKKLSSAKLSRARSLLSRGYTTAEVAEALGVSTSTLYKNL